MENLFETDWNELLRVMVAGVLTYAGIVFLLRISGKRTLSKWNAFDFVVTIALGSTLATGLLSKDISVPEAIVAFATLVVLQFIVTWFSVRVTFVRKVLKSQPSIIFRDGNFLEIQMRKKRVTKSEVMAAIRSKGHGSLADIAAVVLETDGTFSVIKDFETHPEHSALANAEGFKSGTLNLDRPEPKNE